MVVIGVAMSAPYHVLPVLLGIVVLYERLRRPQVSCLLAAAAAVVLLTTP